MIPPAAGDLTHRPFIKVCGITRAEDALSAVASGVDAVGFVFVPESPRRVDPDTAAAIARRLPPEIAKVGVVVNRPVREVRELAKRAGLSAVQAHGEETPEECRDYGLPVVKAVAAGEGFSRRTLEPYREFPVLMDAASAEARGGTGRVANWSEAARAREEGFRVLLAGGLGPGNLREAVRVVRPLAVDLNSGVETRPGVKDLDQIRLCLQRFAGCAPPEEAWWPW
jgi:phosphoribosylanthranilate isomerase